jgi:hypothetical protein
VTQPKGSGFGDLFKNVVVGDLVDMFTSTKRETPTPPVEEVPDCDQEIVEVLKDICAAARSIATELHEMNLRRDG